MGPLLVEALTEVVPKLVGLVVDVVEHLHAGGDRSGANQSDVAQGGRHDHCFREFPDVDPLVGGLERPLILVDVLVVENSVAGVVLPRLSVLLCSGLSGGLVRVAVPGKWSKFGGSQGAGPLLEKHPLVKI